MARAKSIEIEKAVQLFQLYDGAEGISAVAQTRMYRRMRAAAERIAKKRKMSPLDTFMQLSDEARRRGRRVPMPGKDY